MKKIQTKLERLGLSLLLALFAAASYGATTDLATAPMVSGSSFSVKPNVFLMMDDSGSMGWDYMPDPVSKFRNAYGYVSSQCNGVYYNPNIVYDPPKKADGTNYPNSSFTAAPPDGYGVTVPVTTTVNLSSQYNIGQYTTGSYSTTGGGPAYYYTYSGTLTTNASKDYYNTTSQFYQECNTALNAAVTDKITVNLNSTDAAQVSSITVDNGSGAKEILDASTGTDAPSASLATDIANHINNCTAAMTGNCTVNGFSATATNGIVTITAPDATYNGVIPVLTTTYSAATTGTLSVTVGSNTAATLPSILVAGKEILQQPINNDTTSSALANDIVNQINLCTAATAGSCTASGFSAMISGTCGRRTTTCTVIISAPASYSGNTPDVSSLTLSSTRTGRTPSGSVTATAISTGIPSGTSSVTASAFSGAAGVGLFHKVTVSTTSGPGGTDEETNFANWFSYYRTRILMMKTATGMAFNNLDSSYRVGFGTMNNNKPSSSSTKCTYCVNGNGNKFLNLAAFDATQKTAFFDMLYNSTVGNSTPLLMALSKVGLMYADKEPSNTFNNVTVVDPMEYSCQQNFTILSTDGFWNSQQNQTLTAGPTNTAVGNTDGSEPDQSKQNDGATHTYTQQTGPLQWQTDQQYTTQPLQWASDLQKTTGALQWSTDLQKATGTLQWTTDLQKASGPLQWTTDLQSATGTLQYSTDLQTASGTLQWTTDLQQTTAPLQWKTDLQTASGTLQWSTDLQTQTGALEWATNLQSATGALQWATNLQQTTAPLQWKTDLQTASGTLQWATNLQTATGALQWATNLQQTTAPLQWATNLQTATGGLQWATNLQQTAGPLMKSTPTSYTETDDTLYICTSSAANCTLDTTTYWSKAKTNTTYTCDSTTTWCETLSQYNGATSTSTSTVTSCNTAYTYNNPGTTTTGPAVQVMMACTPATWSTPTAVGPNGTCTASATTQCSVGTTSTAYVTYASPSCTVNFNAAGSNTADASGNVVTACSTAASYSTPVAVGAGNTCTGGGNVQCSTAAPAPSYVSTYPPTCSNTWNGATGSSTADGSGNVTACSTAASYSTPTATGASASCDGTAANVQCSTGTASTAYVTYASPSCTANFNAAGLSTADASGNVVTACSTAASYSTPVAVGAGNTCTGGGNVQCSTTAPAPSYVSTYPPTCSNTWNGAAGSSTADGSGNVTACNTAASYSTPTATGASASCDGTLANVQCSTSTLTYSYVSTYPPTCSSTWNGTGSLSTADGSGNVTACQTDGGAYGGGPYATGAGNSCDGTTADVQCSTGTASTAYVTYASPSCTANFNAAGSNTADASGNVVTACSTAASYSTPVAVGAGNTCTGGGNVQCSTAAPAPSYVSTYPPTCSNTWNGATGSSTADGSGNVTACSTAASYSTPTATGASVSCDGTAANVQCSISSTAPAPAYVTAFPPTSNCSNTFNATGISTADGSGNVTACTTAASYNSTLTTVPASQTCTTGTDLQCSTTALTYSYVSTYPPTCSATWNGTTGTADASSQVVACQTDGGAYASPALAISSCDGSGTTPDVQCTTGTATTSYVATFPPTCSTTFNATGTSTADGSGNVVTACSPATAGTGTFNTALNNVPANTTCTTSGDLKCVGPSSFSYVTNYPPTCTASWNGTLSTTGTSGTTDSSGNVVACSDSSSGSSFNPTPTNVPVSQSCTTAGNLQCSTTTLTYSYVSTYPPTCTATWNSITNSGTADASGNVVACSGAGSGSFNPTLANVPVSTSCSTAGDLKCVGPSSFSYVTTFPPTCTPSWDGTTGTTDTSGNVVACTPATAGSGTFNPTLATVPANQICSTSGDLKCSTTALTYSYVSTYKPSCVATWNGTTGTADASSQIVACQTDGGAYGGGPHAVGASGQCDGSAADVKCSAALTPPAYVTTYPPTCSVTFTAGSLNTADAYGNVVTACTQTSPTWSTPMAVGSNGSCDGTKADVQCSTDTTAASTSYYTTYPFSCVVGFKPTATSYANNTGLVITACPVAASYDVWRDTATTSTSGDCSASTTVSCQYNWGTASSVASCASNYSTTSPYTVDPGVKCNQNVSGGTFNTLADVAEYYYTTDLRTPTLNNCSSGSTTNPGGILCSTPSLGAPDPYNNVPASGNDTASWQHMSTFTLGLGARGRMIFDPAYPQETSTSAVHDYYDINLSTAAPPTVCSWQTVGSGTCTWPIPNASGGPENIDDLWHAAIDGRGTYFSATDPTTLSTGLVNALATVRARTASAASAAISNPNVSSGDNFLFASTYTTLEWTGELVEEQINLLTGQPLTTVDPVTGQTVPVIDWSAQTELDAENWASRPIYTFDATNASGNNLKPFTWTKLTATEQAYFTSPAINALSQLCTGAANCLPVWQASYSYNVGDEYRDISTTPPTWYHVNTAYTSGATFGATDTTNASVVEGASGSNLVNFLAGDRSNEEGTVNDPTKYFRHRTHVLGDIVDSEAVYVGKPLLNFSDPGYSTYATLRQSRQPMIFVAANDGMLHAFYTASDNMDSNGYVVSSGGTAVTAGAEAWSFIPSIEMQNLYKLADKNYANQHQYFTDGTPVVTDICISNCTNSASAVWKTILVAGMNGGGRGYYALDITNPGAPKALWEFTDVADPMVSPSINTVDSNMGYSYGNPTIAKTGLGNWVVMFSSGYNNVSPGDGQGHLYVLNAYTGTLDTNVNPTGPVPGVLDTGVGSTTTPSGLARISAEVVDPQTDLTTVAVYGGDLLGNLWRFDVNGDVGASTSGYDAQLLATLLGPNGVAEPITVRPEVGIVGTSSTMVYVGTGRYLGSSDLNATDQLAPNYQNVYGIYDPLTTPSGGPSTAIYSDPRNDPTFVGQQLSLTTCPSGAPTTVCAAGSQILTSTTNTANIPTNHGWYVDFPTDASLSGLRDNTDPLLAVGTLAVNLNLPSGSSCSIGGSSYGLSIDYSNGGPVSSATFTVTDSLGFTTTYNVTGIYYGNALATHPILMTLPNGVTKLGTTLGDNTFKATDLQQGVGAGGSQRVSWRILQ